MKSDDEIKEWIDNREVVTQTELMKFIYGYYTGKRSKIFGRWWLYVIEYKDPVKLKEYANTKQQNGSFNIELFDKVKELYTKDCRIREFGYRSGAKLLRNTYDIEIADTTFHTYKRKLQYELV